MSKKKYTVIEELDPEGIEGISALQKRHYISLGYKPFLMGDGKTKWLTDAQRVYKETKSLTGKSLKSNPPMTINGMVRKRRRRNRFVRFITDHWFLILIIIAIVIGILYFMKYAG